MRGQGPAHCPALPVTVRQERFDDAAIVRDVVRRAYTAVPYSDHREHLMVERLRGTEAWLAALSLLAEAEGEVVGHILLTKARIGEGATARTALALAPLSVVPEAQRLGVGTALVEAAHEQAAALGHGIVLVLGIPGYYERFGYERMSRYAIELPFAVQDSNCLIIGLRPGALDGISGRVRYGEGWLDH
jgi:predicted N-acetyltransferase YhbS